MTAYTYSVQAPPPQVICLASYGYANFDQMKSSQAICSKYTKNRKDYTIQHARSIIIRLSHFYADMKM